MNLRGLIFDLDGTLGDTHQICTQSLKKTIYKESGRLLADSEVHALFGLNEEGILQKALPGSTRQVYEQYLELYARLHAVCTRPFDGIPAVLDLLQTHGLKTGIVSGKSAETAAISLRYMGLAGRFEVVVTGFLDRADKPAQLRGVARAWDLPTDRLAYVGDAPTDLTAAETVGMLPLGAAWAQSSALRGHPGVNGHRIMNSVAELIDWIKQIPSVDPA